VFTYRGRAGAAGHSLRQAAIASAGSKPASDEMPMCLLKFPPYAIIVMATFDNCHNANCEKYPAAGKLCLLGGVLLVMYKAVIMMPTIETNESKN
jgi:hypothetical protein